MSKTSFGWNGMPMVKGQFTWGALKDVQSQKALEHFTSLVGHGNEQDGLSNTRVGELILVINSPRKQQNKNKINVCSILVNRIKNYNLDSNDWMILEYVFWYWIFWGSFIIGGMLMWLGLLASTTKRTYNHNMKSKFQY